MYCAHKHSKNHFSDSKPGGCMGWCICFTGLRAGQCAWAAVSGCCRQPYLLLQRSSIFTQFMKLSKSGCMCDMLCSTWYLTPRAFDQLSGICCRSSPLERLFKEMSAMETTDFCKGGGSCPHLSTPYKMRDKIKF